MFRRRGQSTVEYALIIAVVVAGLLAMQFYVKRGYSGRLKSAGDDMGDQYDPQKYTAKFNVESHSKTYQEMENNGKVETTYKDMGNGYGRTQKRTSINPETIATWGGDLASQ